MAARRMFAKSIVQSSKFLKMPVSSRELYFQLGMSADDDGIVEAWNVMKLTNATEDDLRVLISKGYITILNNEDLIAYLIDWKRNNLIRADRKSDSIYKDLLLMITDNRYDNQLTTNVQPTDNQLTTNVQPTDNQLTTNVQPTDNQCATQYSIGKYSIDKINKCPKEHKKEVEDFFESVWTLYVRKEGKNQVKKEAKEEIFNVGYDRMKACIEKYIKEKSDTEKKYLLMGSTFFNGRYKDYLPTEENNQEIEKKQDEPEEVEITDEEWEAYVQSEEWEEK